MNNEDQYIAALNEQLEELKIIKAQEEKEIQQSIPTWFIKVPRDEKKMYVRGTAVVDTNNQQIQQQMLLFENWVKN